MVRMFMIICSLCFSYISFASTGQQDKDPMGRTSNSRKCLANLPTPAIEASELEEPQWFVEISSDGNESEKERCALR